MTEIDSYRKSYSVSVMVAGAVLMVFLVSAVLIYGYTDEVEAAAHQIQQNEEMIQQLALDTNGFRALSDSLWAQKREIENTVIQAKASEDTIRSYKEKLVLMQEVIQANHQRDSVIRELEKVRQKLRVKRKKDGGQVIELSSDQAKIADSLRIELRIKQEELDMAKKKLINYKDSTRFDPAILYSENQNVNDRFSKVRADIEILNKPKANRLPIRIYGSRLVDLVSESGSNVNHYGVLIRVNITETTYTNAGHEEESILYDGSANGFQGLCLLRCSNLKDKPVWDFDYISSDLTGWYKRDCIIRVESFLCIASDPQINPNLLIGSSVFTATAE